MEGMTHIPILTTYIDDIYKVSFNGRVVYVGDCGDIGNATAETWIDGYQVIKDTWDYRMSKYGYRYYTRFQYKQVIGKFEVKVSRIR